jgi:hypothetical protein
MFSSCMHAWKHTYTNMCIHTLMQVYTNSHTHWHVGLMHTYITNMCIHALMQAYTNSQSHLNVGLHSWITYSYAYTRMYIQAHTLIPKRIDPCIYPYTHTYRHANIHACMQHAYIHTYIHTCIHTCMQIFTDTHLNSHVGFNFHVHLVRFSYAYSIHTCSYRLIDLHLLASIHPYRQTDRQTETDRQPTKPDPPSARQIQPKTTGAEHSLIEPNPLQLSWVKLSQLIPPNLITHVLSHRASFTWSAWSYFGL